MFDDAPPLLNDGESSVLNASIPPPDAAPAVFCCCWARAAGFIVPADGFDGVIGLDAGADDPVDESMEKRSFLG